MTNTEDVLDGRNVLDSRDVIARFDELEAELEAGILDPDDHDELETLRKVTEAGETFADWIYGVTLVRDSHWVDYAKEFADEIGRIDSDAGWPYTHIDWEGAAEALQADYAEIDIDGVTYWAR
jgi:hypothetical protein